MCVCVTSDAHVAFTLCVCFRRVCLRVCWARPAYGVLLKCVCVSNCPSGVNIVELHCRCVLANWVTLTLPLPSQYMTNLNNNNWKVRSQHKTRPTQEISTTISTHRDFSYQCSVYDPADQSQHAAQTLGEVTDVVDDELMLLSYSRPVCVCVYMCLVCVCVMSGPDCVQTEVLCRGWAVAGVWPRQKHQGQPQQTAVRATPLTV